MQMNKNKNDPSWIMLYNCCGEVRLPVYFLRPIEQIFLVLMSTLGHRELVLYE